MVGLEPGATYALRIHPVVKSIGGARVRMLAYNGSIPGPTLRVRQGSEVAVEVHNDLDIDTTVHWHGLRLENRYDGVPHETQSPIPAGGRYTHRLKFPDPGVFWYHPHMREDYAQEMGLYGNIVVEPSDPSYWPPADREVVWSLDDILIEDGGIAPFDREVSNFIAMGRFGNVLLIGGETTQHLQVDVGDVTRLALTNTANTRVFKVALPGARMKLVGGDAGRYEGERWVDDVVIAPSERAVFDVLFDRPGTFALHHVTPGKRYELAQIVVGGASAGTTSSEDFSRLRVNSEMVAERDRILPFLDAAPDKTLALVAKMDFDEPEGGVALTYVCPMHPEVVASEPGQCPKCGMKLMPQAVTTLLYTCPMHPEVVASEPGSCPKCGMKLRPSREGAETTEQGPVHGHDPEHDHGEAMADGIEWEDMMFEVNRSTTSRNMVWKILDRDTGKAGADIDWRFGAGDQIKIRLVNEMESDHPMHHPFHVHGQRFLVLARDGVVDDNLVWKDTVLVRTGETVDILLDASNPGVWMAHCHIAEHMEGGMMFTFRVEGGGP